MKNHETDESINSQQRHQANQFLILLQWTLLILLFVLIFWLYRDQQQIAQQINERKLSHDQLINRLNDIDDRLFSIQQNNLVESSNKSPESHQADPQTDPALNQIELIRIQLQVADKLLSEDNFDDTIKLLQNLNWQLDQSHNQIAPPLTQALKNSLNEDIKRLQAQHHQISPWQEYTLALKDLQSILRTQLPTQHNRPLTLKDAIIYQIIMNLNLAQQSATQHQADMATLYLQQIKEQIINTPNLLPLALETDPPKDLLQWIDDLIKNPPKSPQLTSMQMLHSLPTQTPKSGKIAQPTSQK